MEKFIILFFSLFILFSCDTAETLYTPDKNTVMPYEVYQQIDAFKADSLASYKFITTSEYEYVITKSELSLPNKPDIIIHRYYIDYTSVLLFLSLFLIVLFFLIGFAAGVSKN